MNEPTSISLPPSVDDFDHDCDGMGVPSFL